MNEMVKVKLFEVNYVQDTDQNYEQIIKGITEWEEISEEDYKKLQKSRFNKYLIIRLVEKEEFKTTLSSVLNEVKKEEDRAKEIERKYKDGQTKREQKALERKLLRAKQLLEQHGDI